MEKTYYNPDDLKKFGAITEFQKELGDKFFEYYNSVFKDSALTAKEKGLIALAVAHAIQCPYCIDAYTSDTIKNGFSEEQIMEAVHVAGAIRGGASLVHGVQMMNKAKKTFDVMLIKSLKSRNSVLGSTDEQLKILNGEIFKTEKLPTFREKLMQSHCFPLKPEKLEIFQMNIGYMCNQTCKHCHVDAGPDRKEIMTRETMDQCLAVYETYKFPTVDITGGAPEMNSNFRYLITELRKRGAQEIIVRCNLTIILANEKYHDLPQFFAENKLRVVSSLPFYNPDRTDRQRGEGVFEKSIKALQMLNAVGYGQENSDLILDLVYNPNGAFLPADQAQLERDFKSELKEHHAIEFNALLAITNLPISRFLEYLIDSENFEDYMETLVNAYNPETVKGLMCRNTISIGWDGTLYDCDFNQMLQLKVDRNSAQHISSFNIQKLEQRIIQINQHCFGCTAGSGSSCQGATV